MITGIIAHSLVIEPDNTDNLIFHVRIFSFILIRPTKNFDLFHQNALSNV